MEGDILTLLIQSIRTQLPTMPDEVWSRIERNLREEQGGCDQYIARGAKRNRLAEIEAAIAADQQASTADLARMTGLSMRRVQQLKRLCRPSR